MNLEWNWALDALGRRELPHEIFIRWMNTEMPTHREQRLMDQETAEVWFRAGLFFLGDWSYMKLKA